ncbi:MAG TPA: hypothetical protein PKY61_03290, partial [bacterium]|nr:hypothetical protein [bacterium]
MFFLIFFTLVLISPAQAITGDYNKPVTGTLAASEWNNLVNDFVAKSGARLDGNFSINTATSSGYALDISGILRASHFSGSLSAADVSTGVFGQNTGGGNFNFLGNVGIGIGTASPAYTLDVAGIINANALYVNGAPYIGSQWISNGTSLYYNAGNVGIGISNPSAKFEVSGGNIFINDALITAATPKAAITKEYLDSALASTTTSIITQVATSSFWQGSLTGNVYNANTGNVGIGTANPSSLLTVGSSVDGIPAEILVQTGDTPASASLTLNSGGFISNLNTLGDDRMFSINVGGKNSINILGSGNVGIWTTNPGAQFTINNSSNPTLRFNVTSGEGGAESGRIEFFQSNYSPTYARASIRAQRTSASSNGRLIFATSNSTNAAPIDRMIIDENGNVGIGTTDLWEKFQVYS